MSIEEIETAINNLELEVEELRKTILNKEIELYDLSDELDLDNLENKLD